MPAVDLEAGMLKEGRLTIPRELREPFEPKLAAMEEMESEPISREGLS